MHALSEILSHIEYLNLKKKKKINSAFFFQQFVWQILHMASNFAFKEAVQRRWKKKKMICLNLFHVLHYKLPVAHIGERTA